MNYQKIYDSIISKAKSSDRKKGDGVYYELHHILPKCLGGNNEKENLVLLTAREHYVCHKILFIMYPNSKGISLSYYSMVYGMKDKRKIKLTSREYEEARICCSFYARRENLSPETLNKLSQSKKGERNHFYNKNHNEETLIKMRKPKTKEHKDKISKSKTGVKPSEETIKKMIKANSLENNGFYNKKHTIETRKIQSEKAKIRFSIPQNNPMYGKSGELSPVFGKKQSPEQIAKRVESTRISKELIRQERAMMIF